LIVYFSVGVVGVGEGEVVGDGKGVEVEVGDSLVGIVGVGLGPVKYIDPAATATTIIATMATAKVRLFCGNLCPPAFGFSSLISRLP
jgi:hypothetical protein